MIASPADGQVFVVQDTASIDVLMADDDYTDVTIQFRGGEQIPDFYWAGSTNGPARAMKTYNQQAVGGFGTCTQQRPCTVVILAIKGDQKDVRTISLYYR